MELVKVNHIIALQYGDGKQMIVPQTLLVEWQGQQFLRTKATSSTIITLICGSCQKNASLAASDGLSELVSLRNKVAMCVSENNDEGEFFESAAKKNQSQQVHCRQNSGGGLQWHKHHSPVARSKTFQVRPYGAG